MKKNIWILNHHANGMYFDEGGRHYSFAKYLRIMGYNPVIFCSNAQHGNGKLFFESNCLWEEHINKKIDVPFVFVKGRPYKGNGLQRVLCMLEYYFNMQKVAKEYEKKHGKPDIIIGSQVHPLAIVRAIKLAKKYHVKCIAEIRDLWPESIVAYNMASRKNPIVKLLYKLESWIYEKADDIIFTIGGGVDYILEKRLNTRKEIDINKVHYINNGVDLESFEENLSKYQIYDDDLQNNQYIKAIYVGAIRHVNNIGAILEIAKKINSKVKFLIWGMGDEVEYLKQRITREKIENVIYKGSVEKKYIPYIISKADVNLMDMQDSNEIFKYGISPNKLFEYLAVRKPIIMYQLNNYNPATECGVGFVAENFNDIINYFNEEKYLLESQAIDNYNMAREKYSYSNLTKELVKIIEKG